jgi:hypothetical protein
MIRCSPLGEATATTVEVENIDEVAVVVELERVFGDTLSKGVSDNENSWTYYFRSSTITVNKIKEMEEKCYFLEDKARAPGAETVPELNNDEAVVYEDFFVAGLCMSPHPVLADILLHLQAQLHQLTPNAIAQLSKYFWAVDSFGDVPSGNSFVKRYELHYQPKTIETPEGVDHAIQMPEFSC